MDIEVVLVPGSDEECACGGRRSPPHDERGRRQSVPPFSHGHNHRDRRHGQLHARGPVVSPFEPHDHHGNPGLPAPPPDDEILGMIDHHRGGHHCHGHGRGLNSGGPPTPPPPGDDFLKMIDQQRGGHHRHGRVHLPFAPPPPPPPGDDFLGMTDQHRDDHDRCGHHPSGPPPFGPIGDDFFGMIALYRGGHHRHCHDHGPPPFGPPPFGPTGLGGFWGLHLRHPGHHHHHPHDDSGCKHVRTQADNVSPGVPPVEGADPRSATEGEALRASPSRNPRGSGKRCLHVDCAVPDDVADLSPPSDLENVDPPVLERRQCYLHHLRPYHRVHHMMYHGRRGFLHGLLMLQLHPGYGSPAEAMWNWPGSSDEDVVLRHYHHAHMKKQMKRCAKRCTFSSPSRTSSARCHSHSDPQTRTRSRRRCGPAAPEPVENEPENQAEPPVTLAVEETKEALGLMAINEFDTDLDPKL